MSLSDLLRPRICELGKIKIGGKEEQIRRTPEGREWRAPMKHDHFTVTTLNRNKSGDLVEDSAIMTQLLEEYGDPQDGKLRQIPVAVLSDDPEDIIQASYVAYGGKRVAARSDGRSVEWFCRNGKWLDQPIVENWTDDLAEKKDGKGNRIFKLHTTLNVVITTTNARWGGVYKFRTTSRISADQLYGSLLHLREMTRGVLAGLPLMLVVRPIQVSPQGKTTTVYVVHIELRGGDFMGLQQMAAKLLESKVKNAKSIEQSKIAYRKLLTEPGHEVTEAEIIDITDEFHPEGNEPAPPPAAVSQADGMTLVAKMKTAWGDKYRYGAPFKAFMLHYKVTAANELPAHHFQEAVQRIESGFFGTTEAPPAAVAPSDPTKSQQKPPDRLLVISAVRDTLKAAKTQADVQKAQAALDRNRASLSQEDQDSLDSEIDERFQELADGGEQVEHSQEQEQEIPF